MLTDLIRNLKKFLACKILGNIYNINLYLYIYFYIIRDGWSENSKLKTQNSKLQRGQATVEYFVLFTIIILLTVIGLCKFFPGIQGSFEKMSSTALNQIAEADK